MVPLQGLTRRTWVEEGSILVRFRIGDLRQHATDISDEVYFLLSDLPEDGVLHGEWSATVPDVDGVISGSIDIPISEQPVDVIELLTKVP